MGTRHNQYNQSYGLQKPNREHKSALATWEHVPNFVISLTTYRTYQRMWIDFCNMETRPNQYNQSYDLQEPSREHKSALATWEHVPTCIISLMNYKTYQITWLGSRNTGTGPTQHNHHRTTYSGDRNSQVLYSTAVEQRRRNTNKNMHEENTDNPHPLPSLSLQCVQSEVDSVERKTVAGNSALKPGATGPNGSVLFIKENSWLLSRESLRSCVSTKPLLDNLLS